ncbi:MAG: hypothetical protein H8E18_09650 [FCB group bacterium]|jgi:hypothetical protein|nr:hypothetical protein [FCB group bacterium]
MSERDKVVEAIKTELKMREKSVLNKNAFDALFSAFSNPIAGLTKIFIGRNAALSVEEQRITQDHILDLLCEIDAALLKMNDSIQSFKAPMTVINGLIEAHGENVDEVTGAHIEEPVEFKPGTHIKASGKDAGSVTGLHIGRKGNRNE